MSESVSFAPSAHPRAVHSFEQDVIQLRISPESVESGVSFRQRAVYLRENCYNYTLEDTCRTHQNLFIDKSCGRKAGAFFEHPVTWYGVTKLLFAFVLSPSALFQLTVPFLVRLTRKLQTALLALLG